MNKAFALLAGLLLTAAPAMAGGYYSVKVTLVDQSSVEIVLTDEIKASFTDGEMVFEGGTESVSIGRSRIKSFQFSEDKSAAVGAVKADAPTFDASTMTFSGLPEGSVVTVCGLDGRVLSTVTVGGCYTLPLDRIPAGACVVKVNETVYKIALKP